MVIAAVAVPGVDVTYVGLTAGMSLLAHIYL